MSNVYEPTDAKTSDGPELTTLSKVLLVAVMLLGGIGVLMSLYSGVMIAVSQAGLLAASDAQAEVLAEIQAEQSVVAIAITVLQLLVKIAFSAVMSFGALQWLLGRPFALLRPTLWFGAAFEVLSSLWGILWTVFHWEQMNDQFARSLAADPNIDPAMADSMGPVFATTMVVTMGGMLIWAFVKAGLYVATNRTLPDTE